MCLFKDKNAFLHEVTEKNKMVKLFGYKLNYLV